MRRMKKILAAICLAMVMVLGASTIAPISAQSITVKAAAKARLNKTSVYVSKGDTVQLSIKGASKKVKWTSANKKIATVSTKGKVKGIRKGKTTVTAKVNGKKYNCKINVEVPTISKKNISLNKGSSMTLKMQNTKQKVKWSSSNKKVAAVSTKGKVKGIKNGKVTITAKVGSKKYTCKVTVKKAAVNVNSVSLNESNVTLYEGESKTLKATVFPSNASNKTIIWSSSNNRVATVNKGVVQAFEPGIAIITAEAVNGKKCTCKVIVKEIAVETIKLSESEIELNIGAMSVLEATILPNNAGNKNVIWSSSNHEVATVYEGIVQAFTPGTAIITAEAGGKKSTCKVIVKKTTAETIKLSESQIELSVGETSTLEAIISPNSTGNRDVIWSSSNHEVAIVDKGIIRAIAPGTATITAAYGNKSDSCTVVVKDYDIAIILTSYNLEIEKGKQAAIGATITPLYASNKKVTWLSSDTNIATVDQNGMITAVEMGECDIIATCESKSAVCKVIVNGTPADMSLLEIYDFFPSGTNYFLTCKKGNIEITNAKNGKIDIYVEYMVKNASTSKTNRVGYSYILCNENGVIVSERIMRTIEIGDTVTYSMRFTNLFPGVYNLMFNNYDEE